MKRERAGAARRSLSVAGVCAVLLGSLTAPTSTGVLIATYRPA